MLSISIPVSAMALALGAAASLAGHSADPLHGSWRNPDGSVTIRIDECGAKLCGWVTAASPEAISDAKDGGTELFEDYRRDSANHWSGTVFVPDLSHRFSSHIVLIDHDHARIAGCLIGRFLCQSQIWQRQ